MPTKKDAAKRKKDQKKDKDKNAQPEKELSEEELDQASGGSLNFTSPPLPTVSPDINFGMKH